MQNTAPAAEAVDTIETAADLPEESLDTGAETAADAVSDLVPDSLDGAAAASESVSDLASDAVSHAVSQTADIADALTPVAADGATAPMADAPMTGTAGTVNNIIDMVVSGGPVVWLLLGFSVLALTVSLVKLGQLFAQRQRPARSVEKALACLHGNKPMEAQRLVSAQPNPRAQVLHRALAMQETGQYAVSEIRDEAMRVARLGIARQESHLRILEVIAMLAPLLGLFGTVLGMIEAFRAMEAAGSQVNPAILSGGIWQALLTTAFGLAVAIPVSIVHSWFDRKLEVQTGLLQNDIDVLTSVLGQAHKHRTQATLVRKPIQRAAS